MPERKPNCCLIVALAALRAELRQSLHELRNGVLDLQGRAAHFLPLDKEGRRV
jgi:hypothetical protein